MPHNTKGAQEDWLQGGKSRSEAMRALDELPPCSPRVTGRARAIRRKAGELLVEAGMLARADLPLLERYALLLAEHEQVMEEIARVRALLQGAALYADKESAAMRNWALKLSSELRQLEDALGLTPAARMRAGKHQAAAPAENPLKMLQARRQQLSAAGGS